MQGDADRRAIAWWVGVVVVAGAALMAMGGILALAKPEMVVGSEVRMNQAARVFAGYFAARNLAIAALLLGALLWRRRGALTTLLVLGCAVEAMDLVMDAIDGRWAIVPGVVLVGAGFLVAAMGTRRAARAGGVE